MAVQTEISIMGIPIRVFSLEAFAEWMKDALTGNRMNTLFLMTIPVLEQTMKDDTYADNIKKATLRIPGEEALLLHHAETMRRKKIATDYRCLRYAVQQQKEGTSMYIVGDNEQRIKQYMQYCSKIYPQIEVVGAYCLNMELTPELIINDINIAAPDMVIVMLDSPFQENWIMENASKMCTSICVGIGGVISQILNETQPVPVVFRFLHMNWFYLHMILPFREFYRNKRKIRIFKSHLEKYNNKIKLEKEMNVEGKKKKQKSSESPVMDFEEPDEKNPV
ncbi:MAG: WecB/TagA/CpsF family glycosyltransferase [Clostridiales bacterium]|nr:WecB/TagA/CpsF family glycosyltransferase [Clostridiales bacterium]